MIKASLLVPEFIIFSLHMCEFLCFVEKVVKRKTNKKRMTFFLTLYFPCSKQMVKNWRRETPNVKN
jgi:hypothetical protein